MTDDQMMDIAWANIERHLGDCETATEDDIYENAYVLAFDKLVDMGVDRDTARRIARDCARCFAQP